MKEFHEMLRRITSSPSHNKMMKFAAPLQDHLGINHFWYYQVSNKGYYTYLGTHSAWNEYCFDKHLIGYFECLRDPQKLPTGISLMKNTTDRKALDEAWDKFQINFSLNLTYRTPTGIEAFGFASRYKNPETDAQLLNELPLLTHFTKVFRKRHSKLFQIVHDNQVDFHGYLGPKFYQIKPTDTLCKERNLLLKKLSLVPANGLTAREKEVLDLLRYGHSAPYIATRLLLSPRTVENYLAIIKCKLYCLSKGELIHKAQELHAIGYLERKT